MRRAPLALLTGLALALPGVAADWHRPRSVPPAEPIPASLPPTDRGAAEPDITALPPVVADSLPPAGPLAPNYRILREADTQCLAVRFARLANLLDRERTQLKGHGRALQLRQSFLCYAALDDRNRSAGQALPLYFKAAELEAQIGLLRLSRDDLAGAIRKSCELTKKGFRLPGDPGTLRRQLLDTEADLTRAEAGLVEVNGRLKALLGLGELAGDEFLWPAIEVPVAFEGVDVEAAVGVALTKRPELLLLREMSHDLDAQTLPVVRQYLHGVNGLLGTAPAKLTLPALFCKSGEQKAREGQIAELLKDRERAVADEVRRAVADLHAKARLVALSRERVVSADEHRQDAEQKAERAGGSFLEVLTARLGWYKARGQLANDVMAWHTARARVREAQGVFVWECRCEAK